MDEKPVFAFSMGYVFPLLREIDDGTEVWIRRSALPPRLVTRVDAAGEGI
ncbi:MAG: hypothetical protein OEM05_04430 [Myxococcales bacterium]|nr:hypothetical protein [Myxococcales bacterium]